MASNYINFNGQKATDIKFNNQICHRVYLNNQLVYEKQQNKLILTLNKGKIEKARWLYNDFVEPFKQFALVFQTGWLSGSSGHSVYLSKILSIDINNRMTEQGLTDTLKGQGWGGKGYYALAEFGRFGATPYHNLKMTGNCAGTDYGYSNIRFYLTIKNCVPGSREASDANNDKRGELFWDWRISGHLEGVYKETAYGFGTGTHTINLDVVDERHGRIVDAVNVNSTTGEIELICKNESKTISGFLTQCPKGSKEVSFSFPNA